MALLTWWCDPDVAVPGDGSSEVNAYASQNTLEAAKQMDLSATPDIGNPHCTSSGGSADDGSSVTNVGWTTSAAGYLLIDTKAGDDAQKTGIDASRYVFGRRVFINEDYVRFVGMQFSIGISRVYHINIQGQNTAANDIRIDSCNITSAIAGIDGIQVEDGDAIVRIFDTVVDCPDKAINFIAAAATAGVFNCVVTGAAVGIEVATGSSVVIKNNLIMTNTDDINDVDAGSTIDFNGTDDGDGTNSFGPLSGNWANELLDLPNDDMTLVSGGNAEGGGVDDPGSGLYSTDMDGDSYTSTWSCGVDAKTAAGGIVVLRRRRS